jgi:hypothetical protein
MADLPLEEIGEVLEVLEAVISLEEGCLSKVVVAVEIYHHQAGDLMQHPILHGDTMP